MKKDILTREKIKQDYKSISRKGVLPLILGSISLITLLALLIYLFLLLGYFNSFREIFMTLAIILLLYILISIIYDTCKKQKLMQNNKFYITTDKLVACEEKRTFGGGAFISSFSKPHILYFQSYGKYCIPEYKNYSSSKMFSMNDSGVFNYSNKGDTFYLVICNNKVVLAYNTKLFELKDEKTVSNKS